MASLTRSGQFKQISIQSITDQWTWAICTYFRSLLHQYFNFLAQQCRVGKVVVVVWATTITCHGSHSGFTSVLPMVCSYFACLAWQDLWSSWCYTGGQPSLLRQASSREQMIPCRQSIWSAALRGLGGPSNTTTRLSLFCWVASSVFSQTQTFTQSFTHRPHDVTPSYAQSLLPWHHLWQ